MKCLKLRDGVVCSSDYFAEALVCQTNSDGRSMIFASDQDHPFQSAWVKHLQCVRCGSRYVIADKNRSRAKLIPADSDEARALMDEDRQDFSKSFDPRQNAKVEAPA